MPLGSQHAKVLKGMHNSFLFEHAVTFNAGNGRNAFDL